MMKFFTALKSVPFTRSHCGIESSKRFYQPYKDLGKFKLTSTGQRKTPQIQQYVEHLFRRSNTKSVGTNNDDSKPVFSIYNVFRNMFNKNN